MGKPGKAVYIPSRIALRPDEGLSARPGFLNSRAEVSFPFRFAPPPAIGFRRFRLISAIPLRIERRVAVAMCRQQDRSMTGHAARIAQDRALKVGTEKKSFFEVLVVPFV
jgi:hypothetical protein